MPVRGNTRLVRRYAAFGCLTAALAVVSPEIIEARATTVAAASSRIHVDNFGRVNDRYFRGAQPSARDYADLAAFGIKMVIDLQADGLSAEPGFVEAAGMKFHRIPMTTHTPPTTEQIATFLALVNDPANQPVYVHCAGGRHRTGVMTAVYRMTAENWTPDRAFQEMKQFKFGADFLHAEFKQFVYAFHATAPAETLAAATAG
jgi:tyrosine-protein phosphatase SIW14